MLDRKGVLDMQPRITKTKIKILTIQDKYSYRIMLVEAGNNEWFEAQPVSKGIVRTAEDMKILKIILENDAISMLREEAKQHKR